jgi:hypothetical protein
VTNFFLPIIIIIISEYEASKRVCMSGVDFQPADLGIFQVGRGEAKQFATGVITGMNTCNAHYTIDKRLQKNIIKITQTTKSLPSTSFPKNINKTNT